MNKSLATLIAAKSLKYINRIELLNGMCSGFVKHDIVSAYTMREGETIFVIIELDNDITLTFRDDEATIEATNANNSVWASIPEHDTAVMIGW